MSSDLLSMPHNAGVVKRSSLLDSAMRQLPAAQVKRGDHELERAHYFATEYESVITECDHRTIGDRIIL